ncbi:cell division site-positioning protein MapZ family protein, partial [Streptococcus pneumoniae]|uniref:cell division site-positioning protein MapZ family protein n=1 Tax=Streptococcus pneumoniae TaxID=1313 RepID=UPI001CDCF6F7
MDDSNNSAWDFADGVLEQILATSRSRGYITGDQYILERVNIVNGNGYYNLYKPDGTYLFTLNCTKANFGVVGMAVMGRNLALNIESRGYTVAIYNRSKEKTEDVIACHPEKNFVPSYDVESFVNSIEKPRRIMLMVQAGPG